MGWKYNPFSGQVHFHSKKESEATEEALSAKRLEINKIASGNISKLQAVSLVTDTQVQKAGVSSRESATVFGLALHAASDGEVVRVLLFGHITDTALEGLSINANVYQDANGNLTEVATTIVGEFWSRIGRSFGGGSIFVSPEAPVEVQA